MATPIGPWIAPTLALCAMLLFKMFAVDGAQSKLIALVTASGSVGGILATACGFSFPTLYFLDPVLFNSWLARPWYFCAVMASWSLAAGWFGVWFANIFEQRFLVQEQLAFPVGQLVHKMIAAGNQVRKAYELLAGFIATALFCVMQDGVRGVAGFFPKYITLLTSRMLGIFTVPAVRFDLWPMVWAIGFVTGHVIVKPLAVGMLGKVLLVKQFNAIWFSYLSEIEFTLALCSGMVLAGACKSFLTMPKHLKKAVQGLYATGNDKTDRCACQKMSMEKTEQGAGSKITGEGSVDGQKVGGKAVSCLCSDKKAQGTQHRISIRSKITHLFWAVTDQFAHIPFIQKVETASLMAFLICFLTYFNFSPLAQLYILVFSFIWVYQIVAVAGKIGLAYVGRYATFVMIPGMLLFALDAVQIVLISTFVQIAGGVATDILFGRKMAYLGDIDRNVMRWYQYLGLVVSALTVGAIFWLLIQSLGLGSAQLFAHKAQLRQLLIHAKQFDYTVLGIGVLFGFALTYIKLSPMFVLGGLLMPLNISLGLIAGGVVALLCQDKEEWYPFWSGVFASNSIWMLLRPFV